MGSQVEGIKQELERLNMGLELMSLGVSKLNDILKDDVGSCAKLTEIFYHTTATIRTYVVGEEESITSAGQQRNNNIHGYGQSPLHYDNHSVNHRISVINSGSSEGGSPHHRPPHAGKRHLRIYLELEGLIE